MSSKTTPSKSFRFKMFRAHRNSVLGRKNANYNRYMKRQAQRPDFTTFMR